MVIKKYYQLFLLVTVLFPNSSFASRLVNINILDNNYIMLHFKDGEVIRRDDGTGNCAFMGHCHNADGSRAVYFGESLNTESASLPSNFTIVSADDRDFRNNGLSAKAVFRKSKLNGMSISHWDDNARDYVYDHTMEHILYLQLPKPLKQGKTYTIKINFDYENIDVPLTITRNYFENQSEAIHVNIVGYHPSTAVKSADLYQWLGDGGPRDYSEFEGKKVFLVNTATNEKTEAGSVVFWQKSAPESNDYNFSGTDIWTIDFTGNFAEGNYRLAVEDVGCSQPFEISSEIYFQPYRIATLGFFYMRLGQDSPEINPRPRLPLFRPGVDNTTVPITTLHPYHEAWEDIRRRKTDPWDHPVEYESYTTGRYNNDGWGGHSDAYDWDKRLPHVSIIYDMLLPFILTKGAMNEDDLGIAESGNGIPDLLDEARYEVDSWLRLRDGKGYAHGITCPYNENNRVRYQSANTTIAAWANALNAAMLAEAFRLTGETILMKVYSDSAQVAFEYAENQADQMLDQTESDGTGMVRGRDYKMMAAAYLYNVTADKRFETIMAQESVITSDSSTVIDTDRHNQIWGIAAYLTTDRDVNYPELHSNMKKATIREAMEMEAGYSSVRPSRRSTSDDAGYFWTIQNVQRTIIAHAVTDDPTQKAYFKKALEMEVDWSLGRNPANIIQMTTASTPLEQKRSATAAYTSGYNDGVPGLHPGHTPYWNMNDWAPGMIMGRPSWMASHGYPAKEKWPVAELFFNTDYVWSHTEFTPQQTLRGKCALYTYMYGLSK